MRRLVMALFLVILGNTITAQDSYHQSLSKQLSEEFNLTGGTFLLNDTEVENTNTTVSYGNITIANSTETEQTFSQYFSIDVNTEGINPWDAGINIPNVNAVSKNDNVLVVFWLKGERNNNIPQVSFFVEKSATYEKEILLDIQPDEQWSQYMIGFSAHRDYGPTELVTGLHLAFAQQHIDYGGFALINYGSNYTLQDLPTKLGSGPYTGYEDDAPWRAAAEDRIDKYRKADLQIQFVDLGGAPLKNWDVNVTMKRHEFEFGTAVNASLFANNENQNATYEQKLLDLDGKGNGFNTVVFENALKWRAWEGEWPTNKAGKVRALNWLEGKNMTIRGHNLLWPNWLHMPDNMEANKANAPFLVNEIKNHVSSMLTNPEISRRIKDWDVINEIAVNRDIADALQGKSGYSTGREIYAEIFKQVKEIDPEITTYLNDYITIGQNRDSGVLYNDYKSYIREIIAAGAQIDGIGFQAHIGGSPTAPERIYSILEDFYNEFRTEAKITEYDTDPLVTGELSAKYMEDFLTIILSHQSVKGFLMWGFWDGAHWKNNAPMYNLDWSIKPAGEAFINKVFNEWWFDDKVELDDQGTMNERIFKASMKSLLMVRDKHMM